VLEVPGAYELPLAASWLAKDGWRGAPLHAIVALGCVVRGETPHHEHVARGACDGLLRVALETGVPVGLGVITADTLAQAEARSGAAGGKGGNKGAEAADAALRMATARKALGGPRP
jgi:6,7-dimethyl-8-ribityllumazine synthase